MSFKYRMHPKVSKAEIEVFKSLSTLGLTHGMVTQKTIVLKSTIPDFCWPEKRKAVYLDGSQVHSGDKQEDWDEEVCELLEAKGWETLRLSYDPPLSEQKLAEIVAAIRRFVNMDGE